MTGREHLPEQYFIAPDAESESDCPADDGPECYCIGLDSDVEDCEDPVLGQGSLGQSVVGSGPGTG
eukprot:2039033-Alexandrium_andersonii.AAC.1